MHTCTFTRRSQLLFTLQYSIELIIPCARRITVNKFIRLRSGPGDYGPVSNLAFSGVTVFNYRPAMVANSQLK